MFAAVVVAAAGASALPAVQPRADAVSVQPTAPGTAPATATVIIPVGAKSKGYTTTHLTLAKGGTLTAYNQDSIEHTVTSNATDASGLPVFDTTVPPHTTVTVPVSKLAAGTWKFHCFYHPQRMTGTLVIEGGSGGGVKPVAPKFEQPLVRPPVLTKAHLHIPIKVADVRVLPHGAKTRMWTYGGSYPGPTIVRPAGQDTKVTFTNRLPKSAGALSVHLHGDHHSAAADGQPTTHLIGHGHSRTYNYPLVDGGKPERAATYWYHDHRMMRTSRNVWMGLQAMFILHDAHERSLPLPKGKFDLPLMVAARTFTSTNQLIRPFPKKPTMMVTGAQAPPDDATIGKQILVNGRFAPYKTVSTHRYRLRLVNGNNFTPYDFVLSDGHPFVQIGTGNGLLPKPVVRQDILLGPAQRADVVVDFHRELHKKVLLESQARTDTSSGKAIGTPSVVMMQFRVNRNASTDHTRVPATLQAPPKISPPTKVAKTWTFDVAGDKTTGSYWTVNGKPFNPNRVDYKVRLGATQVWKLHNASPITHFIHIHEEQWHTISRDGHRPKPWERGLEDTWKLDPGETVKVAAKFTDHTGLFMIHCHMLDHEDHGLMAQFKVLPRRASAASHVVVAHAARTTARPVPLSQVLRAAAPVGPVWRSVAFAAALDGWATKPVATLPTSARWMCAVPAKDA